MYYLYKHELLKFSLLNTQMPDVQYVFWQKQKYIKKIIVKKRKEWRKAFLILNIKNGFDVIDTYTDENGLHKIILEKNLLT